MGKSKKKVHVAPVDEEAPPVSPGPLPEGTVRPTSSELNGHVKVNDLEMLKAGVMNAANLMERAGSAGKGEVRRLNMFKKENRDARRARLGTCFKFLMSLTTDPLKEAEKVSPVAGIWGKDEDADGVEMGGGLFGRSYTYSLLSPPPLPRHFSSA